MLENSRTGGPPSCGVSTLGRLDTTIRQVAHTSSTPNLDKSDHEQSGLLIPSPWAVAMWAVRALVAIVGFIAYFGGLMWTHKKLGGWGIALWTAGNLIVLAVVAALTKRFRLRRTKGST